MLFLFRMKNRAKRVATLLICAAAFIWVLLIVGGSFVQDVTQAVGRDPSFTGRTELWRMLLKIGARHPFLGAGYGGYFGTPGNEFQEVYGYVVGHNGLLDVFVELGAAGLILVLAFHLRFYRQFRWGLNSFFDWGVFGLCFLIMSWLLNFSESLFLKSTSYIWSISVLLSVVFSVPYLNSKRNETST
jgi:O-antigen ligase